MIFMVVEIVGGWWAGSLAIMTDAAHLLTDVAAMCLSLFAMYWAGRPATSKMTFGYHRAEILGALASIVTIWGLVAVLGYESIMRLVADARLVGDEVDGRIMTVIGGCGFLVNIIDALILKWGNAPHGHSHGGGGHDHGHGHGNVNVRAAFIHVLGDCLQSIGVMAAAGVIWAGNQIQHGSPRAAKSLWNLADPIASLIFGLITLITTIRLCKHTVEVLMEKVPEEIDYHKILSDMKGLPGVTGVHDLHIWSLTVGKIALSVHINSDDHVGTLGEVQRICLEHGIGHTTIQVDPVAFKDDKCVGTFHHV
jgi:zinc transporter 2